MSSPPIVETRKFKTDLLGRENLIFEFFITQAEGTQHIDFVVSDSSLQNEQNYSFGKYLSVNLDGPLEANGVVKISARNVDGEITRIIEGNFFWESLDTTSEEDMPEGTPLHFEGYMVSLPSPELNEES